MEGRLEGYLRYMHGKRYGKQMSLGPKMDLPLNNGTFRARQTL